jgi:hypothetical protein
VRGFVGHCSQLLQAWNTRNLCQPHSPIVVMGCQLTLIHAHVQPWPTWPWTRVSK